MKPMMVTTNTQYILSTKKSEKLQNFIIAKFVTKQNIYYIYQVPYDWLQYVNSKYIANMKSLDTIINLLQQIAEYQNG